MIDAKRVHNYQPGYTLVATGIWPVEKVVDDNARFMPAKVNWIRQAVVAFEPERNQVLTQDGQRCPMIFWWWLPACSWITPDCRHGCARHWPEWHGQRNDSPEAAAATWQAMGSLPAKGGRAVMTLPHTRSNSRGAAEDDLHGG